ncbi:hypothetical protein [Clostridium sp. BNL1100]|uniref:hypothetical protein n=1 Tax=Clostridium sp. BNL1100 TaxID=755731 RepID=UPI00024A7948|nr:hypothetical protein [Clostridium sp. BNL1100]AEY66549.1 hypothetical protein Clo1100_2376 [Clostridium sp. BNL1100]
MKREKKRKSKKNKLIKSKMLNNQPTPTILKDTDIEISYKNINITILFVGLIISCGIIMGYIKFFQWSYTLKVNIYINIFIRTLSALVLVPFLILGVLLILNSIKDINKNLSIKIEKINKLLSPPLIRILQIEYRPIGAMIVACIYVLLSLILFVLTVVLISYLGNGKLTYDNLYFLTGTILVLVEAYLFGFLPYFFSKAAKYFSLSKDKEDISLDIYNVTALKVTRFILYLIAGIAYLCKNVDFFMVGAIELIKILGFGTISKDQYSKIIIEVFLTFIIFDTAFYILFVDILNPYLKKGKKQETN